ncbi:LLM class flavin-dependent oxidoreductase [Streptomyces sp. V4-01]|uniref:LLM class flavin-dependent oxidoreductase n=1 Tax=Actinacidiphila polyblastidii TaxID=3110430 RepID=A0ABU7PIN7_9ACTN|nr:LLM class flavin-dependent oxidoreductase [Streptomyces sp. V4-01]
MSARRRTMSLAVELPGRGLPGPPPDFAAYARLAGAAERGLFDFVLLTDGPDPEHGDAHAHAQPHADGRAAWPHPFALPGGSPEPVTVLNALAAVTTRIGLAALPSPGREPYGLARGIAALDRLSGGRAAGPVAAGAVPRAGTHGRPVTIREAGPEDVAEGADVVVGRPGQSVRPGVKLLARLDLDLTLAEPAAPQTLAERLDAPVQSGVVDGYVLLPEPAPAGRGLDAFVDLVVPLLQRRGSLRTAYRGTTLREHLGLPPTGVKGLRT